MSFNVLQSVNKSHVRMGPFPHIVIEDALPKAIYDELDRTYPEQLLNSNFPTVMNDRGHTRRYLSSHVLNDRKVSDAWLEFFAYHISNDFYRYVTHDIFSDAIKEYYPDQHDAILNTPSVPRRHVNQAESKTPIVTDCQFVMNNPLSANETSRTPHLDNPVEIYAALLYMKRYDDECIGGDIEIYDGIDGNPPAISGKREAIPSTIRKVGSCPYKDNSVILFLNCRHGAHGVGSIQNQTKVRRSINIIGEYGDGRKLFRI